jgi:hypothetical protein
MTTFCRISLFSILIIACSSPTDQQDNPYAVSLLQKRDSLEQIQATLKFRLDSMWSYANDQLASILPKDMPKQERANMLALRNAPLIKMFEVYETLPASIHELIDSAYYYDKRIVKQLEEIMEQRSENETKIENFLIELSGDKKSQQAFQYWNKQFSKLAK